MLAKSLLVLAMQAGHTLVDVAAGDEWETAQRGYAQMLGRGDAKQTRLAEQRLRTTRKQLIGAAGSDVGLIRKALAIGWANWLADLLEEHPDAEADLQALVQEIPSVPPAERHLHACRDAIRTACRNAIRIAYRNAPASSHAVSANGDAIIDAAEARPEHPGALAERSQLAYSIGKAGDAADRAGPVRRAAAGSRARLRPRAPRHPGRPRQPGLLDRSGRGRGRPRGTSSPRCYR